MAPKRPATSQGGPSPKKAAVSKGKSQRPTPVSKAPKSPKEPKSKARARPVTQTLPLKDESDTEVDDELDDADEPSLVLHGDDEDDEVMLDPQADVGQVDTQKRNEQSRAVKKEALKARKAAKPNNELISTAKKQWALARKTDISKAERTAHVKALMGTVRGHVQELVFKHDSSRIVQTLVKYGGSEERNEIALELKGKYRELSENKYSKFLVTKLIRYCPAYRSSILSEFQNHVLRLLLHREASRVISDAFELYCTAGERALLLRDFYGREVALFDTELLGKGGLKAVLEGANVERRRRVLQALRDNLLTIYNNPDKGASSLQIVHKATWEYLSELSQLPDEEEREQLRREVFENCFEQLAEFVHTREGSRIVREFLARGNAKDRKQIMKTLKPHLEKICKDEEAQLVLLTALDVIDDTKLLAKSVVSDITDLAPSLSFDKHKLGRRVLLYLLVPRTPRHFTPATLAILAESDAASAKTSKKDPLVRREEVRKAASVDLIACVASKGEDMMKDPGASLVVAEVMLYADGDKSSAVRTLLNPFKRGKETEDLQSIVDLIDMPHVSRLYKTLIQGGHFDRETSSVILAPSWSGKDFATAFFEAAGPDVLLRLSTTSGAFLLAELVEKVKDTEIARSLHEIFTEDVQKKIRQSEVKGRDVLLRKLEQLR